MAICLSGGGIRSASFGLGGLQALALEHDLAVDIATVSAVSGGSYIGASKACAEASAEPAERPNVYALRSPEEQHLRRHTHYLLPDAASALRSALCVLFGLAQNLSMVCAWLVASALPVGWLLVGTKALTGLQSFGSGCSKSTSESPCPTFSPGGWIWLPGFFLGVCLLLFSVSSSGVSNLHRWVFHGGARVQEMPPAQGCQLAASESGWPRAVSCSAVQSAMWITFGLALATGFAVLLAPWLIQTIARGALGGSLEAPHLATAAGTMGAFLTGLAALVRLVIGRLSPAKDGSANGGVPGTVSTWVSKGWAVVQHAVLPWLGSAAAVLMFALVWLTAEFEGARWGVNTDGVWTVVGVAAYLVAGRLVIDVNRTSLHSLYRDRLASAFAVKRPQPGDGPGVVPAGATLLSSLRPSAAQPEPGRPASLSYELVICATANINAPGQVPAGTNGISFTFTPTDSGLEVPLRHDDSTTALYRRVPTEDYEKVVGHRHLTLFDMVAISGAAVSPLMGKMSRPPERFLLAMANVRLGVWLPHPALMPERDEDGDYTLSRLRRRTARWWNRGRDKRRNAQPADEATRSGLSTSEQRMLNRLGSWRSERLTAMLLRRLALAGERRQRPRRFFNELRWRAVQPGVRLLLREAMGKLSLTDRWLYVTDGGHYDNLGLVEALRRSPSEVFVFDASGDATTTWSTIGQAVALARVELGVEIRVNPPENLDKDGHLIAPFIRGEFTVPDETGQPRVVPIWFTKLGLWPKAPWDVLAYANRRSTFPTDSTLQQLYNGEEFEAYRALGFAATTEMLVARSAPPRPGNHRSHVDTRKSPDLSKRASR